MLFIYKQIGPTQYCCLNMTNGQRIIYFVSDKKSFILPTFMDSDFFPFTIIQVTQSFTRISLILPTFLDSNSYHSLSFR